MGNINFSAWLLLELDSAMLSLMAIIEKRENMRYVEAESIKREYMEKIGNYEKDVMASELEATLMKKKVELIQACINRREPIDMEKIDSIIEAEKEKQIKAVEASELSCTPLADVSDEQAEEMRKMYKEIVQKYHPEINHDMTQMQKEAYENAVAAYKSQCFEALKLAYDMLFKEQADFPLQIASFVKESESEESAEEMAEEISEALEADYGIAAELFECFKPLENDMIIKNATDEYIAKFHSVEEEIKQMKEEFPFNAVETLKDPEKIQEYLDSLKYRMQKSKEETAAFKNEIALMTGVN